MTPHEKITAAVVLILLLAGGIGFAYHWWVNDWRYWFGGLFAGLSRHAPEYLPGPDPSMPAPGAGELHDEWEALDPDQAADQLIAEWHDDTAERTVTGDVWDQWWNGVDGLERECMLVHDLLVREERLWAELKAETRELCAA